MWVFLIDTCDTALNIYNKRYDINKICTKFNLGLTPINHGNDDKWIKRKATLMNL